MGRTAINTKDNNDVRNHKHAKNKHTKNIKKYKKKIKEKIKKIKGKWNFLRNIENKEETVPTEVKVGNQMISSPAQIAEEYSKHYINKIEDLRKSTTHENFKAINIFRKIIWRVEEDVI